MKENTCIYLGKFFYSFGVGSYVRWVESGRVKDNPESRHDDAWPGCEELGDAPCAAVLDCFSGCDPELLVKVVHGRGLNVHVVHLFE